MWTGRACGAALTRRSRAAHADAPVRDGLDLPGAAAEDGEAAATAEPLAIELIKLAIPRIK